MNLHKETKDQHPSQAERSWKSITQMLVVIIISKISSDICKMLCDPPIWKRANDVWVSTNNQRVQSSGPCHLCRGLYMVRHAVPTALLVRVQWLRKSLDMAVKRPSARHIVFSVILDVFSKFCFRWSTYHLAFSYYTHTYRAIRYPIYFVGAIFYS